jgi:hypothetical protein
LIVQASLAFAVLSAATYLAAVGRLSADAVVALYGAALGAVGSGAVGGTRAASAHTHENGGT